MVRRLGSFIYRQSGHLVRWFKLLFADDDERRTHPDAPTMKNFILFVLTIYFGIAFLKVVYLMEVVVRHDIRTNANANMVFKSQAPGQDNPVLPNYGTAAPTPAPAATADNDQPNYTFAIPDIPQGWVYVFSIGLGVMAGMSASKKIAELKYKSANGNGGGQSDAGASPPTT